MKKNIFYFISPCVIAVIAAAISLMGSWIGADMSDNINLFAMISSIPFMLFTLLVDIVVKSFVRENTFHVWVIEIFLLIIIVAVFLMKVR